MDNDQPKLWAKFIKGNATELRAYLEEDLCVSAAWLQSTPGFADPACMALMEIEPNGPVVVTIFNAVMKPIQTEIYSMI